MNAFVGAQQGLSHPDIVELTNHYYPLSDCSSGDNPTIAQLLGTTVRNNETTFADGVVSQAKKLGLPAVMDEGNSVVCEGMPNVSDVFASALWSIDDQLDLAREGVSGDYMHGTVLQCDTGKPLFMYYTPLCAPTAAAASAGTLAAQPEYYGLATVREIGTGRFLNLTNPDWANVRAYAVRARGRHDDRRAGQRHRPGEQRRGDAPAEPRRELHLRQPVRPDRARRPDGEDRHHDRRPERAVQRLAGRADHDAGRGERQHPDGQRQRGRRGRDHARRFERRRPARPRRSSAACPANA